MSFPDDSATGGPQDEVMLAQFDHQRWEQLRRDQLGIGVVDPLGHQIGKAAAGRYEPVDGLKYVLVGEFDHYGWYNPSFLIFDGQDADFNIHLAPDPPFRFLLDQVAAGMDDQGDLQKRQRGPGFCVECEITPDEGFFNNEYFPTDKPYDSPLIGQKLGVYGPWVHITVTAADPRYTPAR